MQVLIYIKLELEGGGSKQFIRLWFFKIFIMQICLEILVLCVLKIKIFNCYEMFYYKSNKHCKTIWSESNQIWLLKCMDLFSFYLFILIKTPTG